MGGNTPRHHKMPSQANHPALWYYARRQPTAGRTLFRSRSRGFSLQHNALPACHFERSEESCETRNLLGRGEDFSSLTLVEMTWLAVVEMTFHSTLKEPLSNPWEPLNNPRCFTNLFRYSSAVNGYASSLANELDSPDCKKDLPRLTLRGSNQ